MTERQILLIKNSWSFVIVKSEETGELFYHRLFEIAPEVEPLFKGRVRLQAGKLMSMLTFIVSKLQHLDDITSEIEALAKRHNQYQIKIEYYALVGEALLWTLEKGLAEKWNNELKDAWVNVYYTLAETMINASQKLETTPSKMIL